LGAPIAGMLFTAACAAADRLAAQTRTAGLLVHGDLCYANVLRGEREDWLAIDSRPRLGDPELAVPELLWPRVDEIRRDVEVRSLLEAILASGDLDAELARDWALARAADYLLWGLENGLTRDPIRCERVLHALA
jgi:streptomycin 6-kinase